MQVLFVAHNLYVEPTNGAARSLRTVMEWLNDAGHDCRAVTTGRFDQSRDFDVTTHHNGLGVPIQRVMEPGSRPVVRYRLGGVAVTAVETRHQVRTDEDEEGNEQFRGALAEALLAKPDVVLAYGSHYLVHSALAQARRQGARTIFTVRAWGYYDRGFYIHADRVLMNSGISVDMHAQILGLRSDWLPSPLVWSDLVAPEGGRGFVTFVNPALHKGAAVFARLADMLGAARPDIPLLVIQSGDDGSALARIEGLDLTRHSSIMVSPPLARSADIYALTRILLVPSVFAEPFGRVAAEAMINGIPPLVSNRGGLPETVGSGGIVLSLPDWLVPTSRQIPSEAEVQPWFDAVIRLWDDEAAYAAASAAARVAALDLYDEAKLRRRYADYFEDPGPFSPVLPSAAS